LKSLKVWEERFLIDKQLTHIDILTLGKRFRRFLEIENIKLIKKVLQKLVKKLDDKQQKICYKSL